MTSPKYNFSFLSLVLRTLTDNFVVQKFFSCKSFPKKQLFLKFNFYLLSSFLFTPLIIFTKPFKTLIILKVILCKKLKRGPKHDFCFPCSLLRTPTDNSIIQKTLAWKCIFMNSFFCLENTFFTAFLSNPFNKFYQTIQNTFFMKLILYN